MTTKWGAGGWWLVLQTNSYLTSPSPPSIVATAEKYHANYSAFILLRLGAYGA